MLASLPAPVFDRLCRVVIEERSPAYLLVSPTGQLLDWGGNWTIYGIFDLQQGEAVSQQVLFLEGLLPLNGRELFLPRLKTDHSWCADVYFFPGDAGDWVLLLDASLDELQSNLLQQYRNDLSLLQSQHAQLLHHQFSASPHAASHLLAMFSGGERHNLTILCANLCEFVTYSEQHTAAVVFQVLNLYLRALSQAIVGEAGLIEQLTGGAITAYFGILPSTHTAATQAIQAAHKIQAAVQEINQFHRTKHQVEFEVAIGIASGMTALGIVGSPAYRSLRAIGNSVNLAAALQQQASPGEILIDATTFTQANNAQQHFTPSMRSKTAMAEPVQLYSNMQS